MTYAFDHLVVMARDRMDKVSGKFQDLGFCLTETSKHNLGSSNRLIVLDDSYIEILGWEFGTVPQRKEIAELPYGLEALVFRTSNADECYENLNALGFMPNPVQDLSRDISLNGAIKKALFKTVRFDRQPIDGLRMYFCQHLTPEYVWIPADMRHTNQLDHLREITLLSANPQNTTMMLKKLLQMTSTEDQDGHSREADVLNLGNCLLKIRNGHATSLPAVEQCVVESKANATFLTIDQSYLRY